MSSMISGCKAQLGSRGCEVPKRMSNDLTLRSVLFGICELGFRFRLPRSGEAGRAEAASASDAGAGDGMNGVNGWVEAGQVHGENHCTGFHLQ